MSGAPGLTIALDGPAASGKGTLARRIAAHYGLNHLDTGLTYRAVAKALADAGEPLDDEALAERAARSLDPGALDRTVLST
ncbi:(d)CMP kinase, partial [Nitratireductor sp. GCM10026969]|uniref:(d)CMP kinase n=1 Tax=Nitratireductor sp. GCM10026969 TaxID=3252645 RepID=UPI003618B691